MTRSQLAFGLSSLAGMTLAGVTSASAQIVYVDEGAYVMPPAYAAPAVPPGYYLAPQGYVAAPAYTYTVPTAPLAMVPVAPPAYGAAPGYVERVVPAITPRQRVMRRVIVERRPAYPRYDSGYDSGYDPGYVTYEER
jgi:hypothetical protein